MSEDSGPMEVPGKPGSRQRKISEEVKRLSRSEKVRNYCIGIGALSALILGVIANFKGEPIAEKAWETLRDKVNKQTIAIKRLHNRVVYFQAHEEGKNAAELQLKLDALQRKFDSLKAKKTATQPEAKTCGPGFVLADNKCRKASTAVVRRVVKETKAADKAEKKLLEERRKNLELERRLQKNTMQQQQSRDPLPNLVPLPKKLDDAAKK